MKLPCSTCRDAHKCTATVGSEAAADVAWQWVAHMKAISAQPRNAFAAESLHAQYSLRHYARLHAPFVPVLGVAAADHRWTGSRDDVLIVKVPSTAQPSRPMPFPRPRRARAPGARPGRRDRPQPPSLPPPPPPPRHTDGSHRRRTVSREHAGRLDRVLVRAAIAICHVGTCLRHTGPGYRPGRIEPAQLGRAPAMPGLNSELRRLGTLRGTNQATYD